MVGLPDDVACIDLQEVMHYVTKLQYMQHYERVTMKSMRLHKVNIDSTHNVVD